MNSFKLVLSFLQLEIDTSDKHQSSSNVIFSVPYLSFDDDNLHDDSFFNDDLHDNETTDERLRKRVMQIYLKTISSIICGPFFLHLIAIVSSLPVLRCVLFQCSTYI